MARRDPPEGFLGDEFDPTEYGEAQSWYQLVGPLYHAGDNQPGQVRMGFYSEQRYISSMGRVHGGMMSSFMDYLLFNTARSSWGDTMLVTVALNVTFISACPADQWVIGHGTVIHTGKSMAFVSGEARCGEKIIVQATGTFRKLDNKVP